MANHAATVPEASSEDRADQDLSHILKDDQELAQGIISRIRGYGVTIQPSHSAVAAIAAHRRKYSNMSDDTISAFRSALEMIAAGHGCPSALANDVLAQHPV